MEDKESEKQNTHVPSPDTGGDASKATKDGDTSPSSSEISGDHCSSTRGLQFCPRCGVATGGQFCIRCGHRFCSSCGDG